MKRGVPWLLVGALVVALPSTARASDPDPWFGRDKALHFGVSGAIAAGGYTAGAALFDARGHALLFGGGVALAAGIGKEVLDATGLGDPSFKDLAWDVAGTAVGLALAWAVDALVRGVDEEHPAFARPAHPVPPAAGSTGSVGAGLRLVF